MTDESNRLVTIPIAGLNRNAKSGTNRVILEN